MDIDGVFHDTLDEGVRVDQILAQALMKKLEMMIEDRLKGKGLPATFETVEYIFNQFFGGSEDIIVADEIVMDSLRKKADDIMCHLEDCKLFNS